MLVQRLGVQKTFWLMSHTLGYNIVSILFSYKFLNFLNENIISLLCILLSKANAFFMKMRGPSVMSIKRF